ncbi:MAG: PDZ domain-containing protein [Gaiellales bacterium]
MPDESTMEDEGGIYMVDILVRKASLFERLFPEIHDSASLVPEEEFNPTGVSEPQRRQSSLNQMSRSQQIAVAVALRELDYDVEATPIGAEVALVLPASPAEGKLQPGDVIVGALGERVRSPADLRDVMEGHPPGDPVELEVRRTGRVRTIEVGTRADPEDAERALVGVLVEPAVDIELPLDIKINAGDVGGPSAGLAFALDVVDELGRDIDRGRKIAATGELDLEGNVGAIGGIEQKAAGARLIDADVFVVPEDNAAEARQHADGLEIIAVSSFEEALAALATG